MKIDCFVNEVKCYFLKFKFNKFFGFDYIVLCIFKLCVLELVFLLMYMINKLLFFGFLFEEWKYVDIIFLYKKGFKFLRENYCLIFFILIVCKICEKIVFDRMIKFWCEIDFINSN